jgi:hypothetical protein
MTQDLYKQKKSLELSWEQEYNESGRYTLNMVKIDDKIKEIITEIKLEEASRSFDSNLRTIKKSIFYYRIPCAFFKKRL